MVLLQGLGEPPPESNSARNRRSGLGSRTNSSGRYSASNNSSASSEGKRRSGVARTDDATMDEIKCFCAQMGANDWKERQTGIQAMYKMALEHPHTVGSNITKVRPADSTSTWPCL